MTITLPDARGIVGAHRLFDGLGAYTELTGEEVSGIEDAICAGRQLECYFTNERQPSGEPMRETCLTYFKDPRTGENRYAVESWDVTDVRKWDFARQRRAQAHFHAECDRLGV